MCLVRVSTTAVRTISKAFAGRLSIVGFIICVNEDSE